MSASKWLPFLACVYIKMFCFLSCAHRPKCFVIIVCVHIKMVAFSRVRLNQNVLIFLYINFFFSRVRLQHNVFLYSCVYVKMVALLVRAYIKIVTFSLVCLHQFFSRTCVCLHQNDCRYLSAPVSKCLLVLVSTLFLFLGKCSLVRLL